METCIYCRGRIDNRTRRKGRWYVTIPPPRMKGHFAHDDCQRKRVHVLRTPIPRLIGSLRTV
jgi:hypothetical protein